MPENEIITFLKQEISTITGKSLESVDSEQSLSANGINSMGFIELLLAVERQWEIKLIEQGIRASDVASLEALANRIQSCLPEAD